MAHLDCEYAPFGWVLLSSSDTEPVAPLEYLEVVKSEVPPKLLSQIVVAHYTDPSFEISLAMGPTCFCEAIEE